MGWPWVIYFPKAFLFRFLASKNESPPAGESMGQSGLRTRVLISQRLFPYECGSQKSEKERHSPACLPPARRLEGQGGLVRGISQD